MLYKSKAFVDLIGDSVLNRNPVQNSINHKSTFPERFFFQNQHYQRSIRSCTELHGLTRIVIRGHFSARQ